MSEVIQTPRDAGAFVRGARTRRGLSQAALAERAGVSRQWIVQFERGKARAELIVFLRVLDALGVELTAVPGDGDGDTVVRPATIRTHTEVPSPTVVDLDALLDSHVSRDPSDD